MRPIRRIEGKGLNFRRKVLAAMMLVVAVLTASAVYLAEQSAAKTVAGELERRFLAELDDFHHLQSMRQAVLVEHCRNLVQKPRIHAALEDDALDLLYLNADDELRDVLASSGDTARDANPYALRAQFYRFIDRHGNVIKPPAGAASGWQRNAEIDRLALSTVPDEMQLGYVTRSHADDGAMVSEVIAMPITSGETGEVIAALMLGFTPIEFGRGDLEIKSGLLLDGKLFLAPVSANAGEEVSRAVGLAMVTSSIPKPFQMSIDGTPSLLFYRRLNPRSVFAPAFEVCIYPMTELVARRRVLRWQIVGAGCLILVVGLVASNFISIQLSLPVERLEKDSAENLAERKRAEAALDLKSEELQRSTRFSANASHQLKTPVTLLRAGLEELLANEKLGPGMREELSMLVHQTVRLTGIIEDLLLLSRMDAGRLKLEFGEVDLKGLLEGWLDDLNALPDERGISVELDLPDELRVAGEKRYTSLIVQNLLENACKYNRPGGRVWIKARVDGTGERAILSVANTGKPIPLSAQAHLFERFHRGGMGENIPGHGLGLNLARELARLHRGELRLVRSDEVWTEFEVSFCLAKPETIGKAAK